MRGLKVLGVLLTLVLVLAVVLDVVGRNVAESKVADALQKQYGISEKPDVAIHGFSFLVQALSGTYSDIDISAKGIPVENVAPIDVTIDAQDVQLPLSKALNGDVASLPVGHAKATAAVPLSVVTKRIGDNVKLTSLGGTKVQAEATTTVVGVDLTFKAVLDVRATGGVVHVTVVDLSALGVSLPSTLRSALSDQLTFTFDLPSVVKSLELTDIDITGDTITLTGEGSDLVLS